LTTAPTVVSFNITYTSSALLVFYYLVTSALDLPVCTNK